MVDQVAIGPALGSDGTVANLRGGRLAEAIMSQLNARSYEIVRTGRSFCVGLLATTTGVAAGNVNLAAAAASTQFAVWNPSTSGVNMALRRFMWGFTSGTPVGGPLFHSTFSAAVPTIASVGTGYNNLFGQAFSGQGRFAASAAGTALTGGSALVTVRPSTIAYSAGAFAAVAGAISYEDIDGQIVLAPGSGWVPTFGAAGTSLLSSYGLVWDEVPV